MNNINEDFIYSYLSDKIKDGRIVSGGQELTFPSYFAKDDHKRHMSVNLYTGLWQCFKTGRRGNFTYLYSIIEDIPMRRAISDLMFKGVMSFNESDPYLRSPETVTSFNIPIEHWKPVPTVWDDCSDLERKANNFIFDRGLTRLHTDQNPIFFTTTDPKAIERHRLIIAYVEADHDIIYYQARALYQYQTPKYINPPKIKASLFLLPFKGDQDTIFVTEGPLDAFALKAQGLDATCTTGSSPSEYQVRSLYATGKQIVVAYDNDEAGYKGLQKFEAVRKRLSLPELYFVFPPQGFKDWGDMDMDLAIYEWISENIQPYNYFSKAKKALEEL